MGDLQGIFVEDQVDRQEVPSINVFLWLLVLRTMNDLAKE